MMVAQKPKWYILSSLRGTNEQKSTIIRHYTVIQLGIQSNYSLATSSNIKTQKQTVNVLRITVPAIPQNCHLSCLCS